MFYQPSVSQPVAADCRLSTVHFQPVQVRILQAAVKCKGKEIPTQAWKALRASRSLKLPEFQHSRHMKVVRLSAARTGRL